MSQAVPQQQILTEEELVPAEKRVAVNVSNFRIDPQMPIIEPPLQLALKILKHHTIYNALILTAIEEFEYQIKSIKNKKAGKILYPRYTKLIIDHFLSENNDIAKRSYVDLQSEEQDELMHKLKVAVKGEIKCRMKITDVMINDDIKKSLEYKSYLAKIKGINVPMAQSQSVMPTQGTHRDSSASVVRTKGKGLMKKGSGAKGSRSASTKIVIR
ncbi:hypothetical protein Tco_0308734 [Tanacetum coccineum]